jgi:5-formyltetrahydrofolate cyclo-ligase
MKNNQRSRETDLFKKKLRKEIREKRDSIPIAERKRTSKIIVEKFHNTNYYIDSNNILAYYPFGSEIDTTILISSALENNKSIILPKVYYRELRLYYVDKLSEQLERGKYGILEPVPRFCKPAEMKDIDLAVVPGIGFDKNLNRLGYGRGFYDRFLKLIPEEVKKIALCFDVQVVEYIPVSEHDIKIDLLITESEIYWS